MYHHVPLIIVEEKGIVNILLERKAVFSVNGGEIPANNETYSDAVASVLPQSCTQAGVIAEMLHPERT